MIIGDKAIAIAQAQRLPRFLTRLIQPDYRRVRAPRRDALLRQHPHEQRLARSRHAGHDDAPHVAFQRQRRLDEVLRRRAGEGHLLTRKRVDERQMPCVQHLTRSRIVLEQHAGDGRCQNLPAPSI